MYEPNLSLVYSCQDISLKIMCVSPNVSSMMVGDRKSTGHCKQNLFFWQLWISASASSAGNKVRKSDIGIKPLGTMNMSTSVIQSAGLSSYSGQQITTATRRPILKVNITVIIHAASLQYFQSMLPQKLDWELTSTRTEETEQWGHVREGVVRQRKADK